ncbi:ABC transporter permease [Deinococcus fonticola]|uniref:ABC transporter permease n=1 Tax=Deinococcus fonticola TaxID=2528713 RepID=UPI001074B76D|nr:ABC transporter permease [Deinococcus fonticola]
MQAAYILKRLAYLLVTLLLTGSLVFLALRILPGDAETLRAGLDGNPPPRTATPSIGHQYLDWLSRLSRGDLGRSLRDDQSVLNVLGGRVGVTLSLALPTVLLSWFLAGVLAMNLVQHEGKRWANLLTGTLQTLLSAPLFWLALLLTLALAVELKWLPLLGYVSPQENLGDWLKHLILPVVSLTLPGTAFLALSIRNLLRQEAGQDYLRTALSKGISRQQLLRRHALKPVMAGLLSLLALHLGGLLTGTVLIEQVFTLPGLGSALVGAVAARDYPVVEAFALLSLVIYGLLNLIADLGALYLDPRGRQ